MSRATLLAWYDLHARPLPWRLQPTPWRVWVSEVMCQQTRVASVLPYFATFMGRFPTPAALAAADLEAVYALWAGLGYYSRARNLHLAAQQVTARHGGEVPNDPVAFRALRGVGRYTCGAVQSIAFGRPLAALDGNVARVLSRIYRVAEEPRAPATQRLLWAHATRWVEGPRPGDLNQALMELGATLCGSGQPDCGSCPLAAECQARAAGVQATLPLKVRRPKRPRVDRVAGLARTPGGAIWLARRAPDAGLLAGLWDLPSVRGVEPAALASLGLAASGEPQARVQHGFTHRIWRTAIYRARGAPVGEPATYDRFQAFPAGALAGLALCGPGLKGLRACGVDLPARRGAGRAPPGLPEVSTGC